MALRIPLLALTRKNLKPEVAYGWASNDACPISSNVESLGRRRLYRVPLADARAGMVPAA